MDEKLVQELKALEEKLTGQLDAKTKKEVEAQIKAIKDEYAQSITDLKAEIKVVKDEADEKLKEYKADQGRLNVAQKSEPASFDQNIKEAVEANHDNIQKYARKEIKSLSFEVKAVADQSTSNITGGSVWGAQYKPGIIGAAYEKANMRDLMPNSQAGPGTDYYFMRESGGEGAPAWTAEKGVTAATTQATGLKPQIDMDFVESSVKFETLAAFLPASNKSLKNIPNFISFLQRRLPQKLMAVENTGILYGTGTSPEIKGILTAGNFVASTSGASVLVEKIIDDLSLLEDTYLRQATGIVMRPADYYTFFKNKAGGSGEYDLPQGVSFVGGVLYILGIPVTKTTSLTAGDYVVGDFVNGAEFLIQESISLQFFEQDGTNVRTNQTTIRIEETVALPVFGSDYFIKGAS